MNRSTAVQLVNVSMAVGAIVALWVVWGPWAALLILATNLVSVMLDRGAKSLEAGGE